MSSTKSDSSLIGVCRHDLLAELGFAQPPVSEKKREVGRKSLSDTKGEPEKKRGSRKSLSDKPEKKRRDTKTPTATRTATEIDTASEQTST